MCFDLTLWQSLYTIVIYSFHPCYRCELFDENLKTAIEQAERVGASSVQ